MVWSGLGVMLGGCASQPERLGPLPTRNQHPAQLTVLHLPPAGASVLPAGATAARLDAAYTSLFLSGSQGTRSFRMDGEYLRAATNLRLGLGANLEVSAELPFAHTSGGFLDSFLVGYHELFGFPDQGRDTTPYGRFRVEARQDGATVYAVDQSAAELLDVPLGLTWQLRAADAGPGLALRGGIELPTGDQDHGYGNGELDASLGVLVEQHIGLGACYGHLQHTWAGTPRPSRDAGLSFADVTSAGVGFEWPLADGLGALVQIEWETSTLRELDFPTVARDQVLLWLGGRWRIDDRWSMEVGFGEDLQGYVSPDFTAWIGVAFLPAGQPARASGR